MIILKCKMCGGDLDIQPGASTAECLYCGTLQTIPNIDNEKRANLFDRASHYRRNNDFDKALSIYEQLVSEDNTDAEAHWSIVLCKYGVEYVEDPRSHRRIPTINRTQYTSIFNDHDYLLALEYADSQQYPIYQYEAQVIDNIQKGILEISRKEAPFDIFICYKETDGKGNRTIDSVIAYEIYEELINKGYRVFFARVTLEDKLGIDYEPYIFAALNSAKIMLVVGTSSENINSVWVKNEWSRYLSLMSDNKDKRLIPVYKDMDPYDMPEEFSYLQGQDYSKIGAMQDLIHGIQKIIETQDTGYKKRAMTDDSQVYSTGNVDALLKRAFQFVDDSNWDEAVNYYNKVLDIDPECSNAYLIAAMVDIKAKNRYDIVNYPGKLSENKYMVKAYKYACGEEKDFITDLLSESENINRSLMYKDAMIFLNSNSENKVREAKKILLQLKGYRDDIEERIAECNKKLLILERKKIKGLKIGVIILAIAFVISGLYVKFVSPNIQYSRAEKFADSGKYDEAIDLYTRLGCDARIQETNILKFLNLVTIQEYEEALSFFDNLTDECRKDNRVIDAKKRANYNLGVISEQKQDYVKAVEYYKSSENYNDSDKRMDNCNLIIIESYIKNNNLDEARKYLSLVDKEKRETLAETLGQEYFEQGNLKEAGEIFKLISGNEEQNKWNVELTVNNSKESTTNMDYISVNDTVYLHVKLTGGPGTSSSIKLGYEFTMPKFKESNVWDFKWYDGEEGYASCYTQFEEGKAAAKVYNQKTYEILGSIDFYIN